MQDVGSATGGADARQRAQRFYAHGMEAAKKGQFDYAIRLLRDACRLCPDVLMFRRALRAVERQRQASEGRKSPVAALKKWRARARLKAALARGNYPSALEACEDILETDPCDVAALVAEAKILDRLGHIDSAVWVAETAVGFGPKDADAHRILALLYEKTGQYSRAIALWERVKQLRPEDKEAASRVKNLAAAETIERGGYEQAEHVHDVLVHHEEQQEHATERPGKSEPAASLDSLKQKLDENPADVARCLELSRRLRQLRRWDEAAAVVERSLHATGGHPELQTELADIEIDRLRFDLSVAQAQLADDPNNPLKQEKVAELERRLNDYELREYRRRAERHPTDSVLKLEYAIRLARARLYDEAITILQSVRQDPRVRLDALVWLGNCFFARKIYRLAERNYSEALAELKNAGSRNEQALKEVHYLLGRTFEEMGNRDEALRHYEEVAAIDFAYRDVAQRLEKLNR